MLPIHSMSPNSERASIRMNRAAKNSNVDHSTLAKMASMSSMSARIIRKMAPSSAVHPKDRRCNSGTECKKNKLITKTNAHVHLISNALLRIGYYNKIKSNKIN